MDPRGPGKQAQPRCGTQAAPGRWLYHCHGSLPALQGTRGVSCCACRFVYLFLSLPRGDSPSNGILAGPPCVPRPGHGYCLSP